MQIDGTGYTTGIGFPDANNIVMWAGAAKANAPFRVYKDGSVYASSLTIDGSTGFATTTSLSTGLSGKISTGSAATDVNTNTTTISGGKIRTGVIQSSYFPGNGQAANGAGYSGTGTAIDLDNGTITSPQFRINASGEAHFAGALSSNVSITAPNIIGLTALSAGTPVSGIYPFYVNSAGKLTAQGAEISGVIQATGGVIGGWTINPTSLSASGMVLNAASQQIIFTNGFQIDNDNFTYDIAGSAVSSSSYYGSDTNTDGTVENSFVSSSPGTTTASSINIKPSSSYSGSSAALFMSTSGYSKLQAGASYISLSSTGVVINTNATGGIVLKGFTSAYHPMYNSAKEAGATLQIFSDGRVTAGRAFYKSGAAESSITNINHATWPYVGLIGDVIFSTAD